MWQRYGKEQRFLSCHGGFILHVTQYKESIPGQEEGFEKLEPGFQEPLATKEEISLIPMTQGMVSPR